jgi:ABC-type phosphate transport system substrate-binding protein
MKALLTLFCSIALLGRPAKADDLAIIVEKNVALDNVTSSELSKIFLCEKTSTSTGTKLVITTRERGSPERAAILATIYKLTDIAYEKFFMQRVFVGSLPAAPKLIPSAVGMKKFVAAIPGSVGYVRLSEVDDTVKIVKIDGLTPGDPNYPLKLTN